MILYPKFTFRSGMRTTYTFLLFLLLSLSVKAQELFPNEEPASNVPRGAVGLRVFDLGYREADLFRNVAALRLMYGVTSKLSVYATGTLSNYHGATLPADFITHDHSGGGVSGGGGGGAGAGGGGVLHRPRRPGGA